MSELNFDITTFKLAPSTPKSGGASESSGSGSPVSSSSPPSTMSPSVWSTGTSPSSSGRLSEPDLFPTAQAALENRVSELEAENDKLRKKQRQQYKQYAAALNNKNRVNAALEQENEEMRRREAQAASLVKQKDGEIECLRKELAAAKTSESHWEGEYRREYASYCRVASSSTRMLLAVKEEMEASHRKQLADKDAVCNAAEEERNALRAENEALRQQLEMAMQAQSLQQNWATMQMGTGVGGVGVHAYGQQFQSQHQMLADFYYPTADTPDQQQQQQEHQELGSYAPLATETGEIERGETKAPVPQATYFEYTWRNPATGQMETARSAL